MSLRDERETTRRCVIDHLKAETTGPGLGFACDTARRTPILRKADAPRSRFGVGMLFPKGALVETQEDVTDGSDSDSDGGAGSEVGGSAPEEAGRSRGVSGRSQWTEGEEADPEIGRANEYLPSAMGISALVDSKATLTVRAAATRYVEVARRAAGQGGEVQEGWRAVHCSDEFEVDLSALDKDRDLFVDPYALPTGSDRVQAEVRLLVRAESPANPGARLITCSLLNSTVADRHTHENVLCECEIGMEATVDGAAGFLEYPGRSRRRVEGGPDLDPLGSEEEASLELLYRRHRTFGVGHGVAADWENSTGSTTTRVWSTSTPEFEVKPVVPTQDIELKMLDLAEAGAGGLHSIEELINSYSAWVGECESQTNEDPTILVHLHDAARRHVSLQRKSLARMRRGLARLQQDQQVAEAFALMNRAMMHQQIRYHISTDSIREWRWEGNAWQQETFDPPLMDDSTRKWRPFQLAFILANLESFADPHGPDRGIVDVIWFPTGGGKTEAYLGLAAFAILLRRLRDPSDSSTAVLTRYTLRLLTTQQFQRTASLACALELLRRQAPSQLGSSRIDLGLWVGSAVTPNRHVDAVKSFRAMHQKGPDENLFVLLSCPWCGSRMGPIKKPGRRASWDVKGYRKAPARQQIRLCCSDGHCEFSGDDGLPVEVVDEALYDSPPTMLIATVDKFAQLPIRPQSAGFLGWSRGTRVAPPPDLIIQDELHLISGPLGTIVGLYETLILELAKNSVGVPPKIVASTATVARAEEQVRGLYGRTESALFPPQGLEWGNSFFAREASELPGRTYVGVFGTGYPSQQTALTRVAAALLEAPDFRRGMLIRASGAHSLEQITDPYWTLVGYFNSTRELGSAATLFTADIPEYLKVCGRRHGIFGNWPESSRDLYRWLNDAPDELTGRVSATDIKQALDDLFVQRSSEGRRAVDVCLATNMIQVGLDVSRLGLMLVAGQPKTAAEYIQATSRVGRSADGPGLVVVMLNPGKPRDRSHYEQFRSFHQRLYSTVEPTSVTPFSLPARQRALHALLIAFVRIWGGPDLHDHPDANLPEDLLNRVRDVIRGRVRAVDRDEEDDTMEEVESLLDAWRAASPPRYGDFGISDRAVVPLMYIAGNEIPPDWDEPEGIPPWPVLGSMRSVSPDCEVRVLSGAAVHA